MDSAPASGPAPPVSATIGGPIVQRLAAALGYRDFRVLWLGACTSSIGTWMQKVAQSWLVLDLTNSASYLALDAFQQPCEHAARTDLIESSHALGQQIAHRLLPLHRRQHLSHEKSADFIRVRVWLGIDIRPHGQTRRAQRS